MKEEKEMNKQCKNCMWYKPEQAELAFMTTKGFCIAPHLEYNVHEGTLVSILDRGNPHPTHQDKTQHIENIESFAMAKQQSKRYALVVQENFGCNYFKKK